MSARATSPRLRLERMEDRLAPAIIQDGVPTWLPAGPTPVIQTNTQLAGSPANSPVSLSTGAVQALAPHPTDPRILFAAGVNGGVWRTFNATDASPVWTPLTDQLPSLTVGDLAINPQNPSSLLFGIGGFSSANGGTPNGVSGEKVGAFLTENALDPQPSFRRLVDQNKVDDPTRASFYSDVPDSGGNYPNVSSVINRFSRDAAGNPTGYMLIAGDNGVFRSLDGGVRFNSLSGAGGLPAVVPDGTQIETVPIGSRDTIFQVVADPGNPNVVYVIGQAGVYRTLDVTAAVPIWVDVTPGRVYGVPDPTTGAPTFAFDPNFPARFQITGQTTRAKIAIHSSAAGNVVYLGVANPEPNGSNLVTPFWASNLLAAVASPVVQGLPASTANWNQMDEPLNISGPRAITNVGTGSPITITIPGHGLVTGDRVLIEGVEGTRAANGVWTITRTSPDDFTLDGSQFATGSYVPGSGTARQVFGINPGGQANFHFAIAADPTNPDLVYIAGDRQSPFFGLNDPGPIGANTFFGTAMRGSRIKPRQFGRISLADVNADRMQFTPLLFNFSSNGKASYADTRDLEIDADGSLIIADDGGVYKRTTPKVNGGAVTAVIGNLTLGQFYRVEEDTLNHVVFGGTQDTGSVQQNDGVGATGNTTWNLALGGDGFWQDVDNTRKVGNVTVRVSAANTGASTMVRRVVDANNNLVEAPSPILFTSATDANYLAGLTSPDKGEAGANLYPFRLNRVDGRLMLYGFANLYEDNDPQGKVGDVVAKINPPGLSGVITAMEYGGYIVNGIDPVTRRPNLVGISRIAYVGTSNGDLFVRGTAGTVDAFYKANLPALNSPALFDPANPTLTRSLDYDPSILDVVVDPEDWRTVYVLRSNHVFRSIDAGITFTDLTANLVADGVDSQGNPVGGLTNKLWSLAMWDGDPGYPNFEPDPTKFGQDTGRYTLLVGGSNGVFRLAPSAADSPTAPWTEFGAGLPNVIVYDLTVSGNTLIAGTQGRGVYIIPDVSGTIQQRARLTITADTPNSNLSIKPDASNPTIVTISDGTTTQQFSLGTVQDFNFRGNGASTLSVGLDGGRGPNTVTVRGNTVEFNPGAGATARPGRVTYSGFESGTLAIDLGATSPAGNAVFVEGTSARTTRILGSTQADTFNIGYAAGAAANLNGLLGDVEVDGRGGGDAVTISDLTATGGNQNVVLSGAGATQTVANIGGPADTAAVRLTGVGDVAIRGSDFIGDVFNVRGTVLPLTLQANAGNDIVRVSSFAGDSDDGDLSGLKAPLSLDAGPGDNRLIVSNYGSPTGANLTVTDSRITGGPADILYFASSGRFANGPAADGILIRGSNAAADRVTVLTTLAGSQLAVDGNGGEDQITVVGDGLHGSVWLRGGAGNDKFFVNPGLLGNTADSLRVTGGGDAADTVTVTGFAAADNLGVTVTAPGTASVTGVRNPVAVDGMGRIVMDGAGSSGFNRNNLTIVDATGRTFGTPTTPLNGIVYQPTGPTSGEVRFGNGTVLPVVAFTNINGSDAAGLVVNGSPTGSTGDVLTVLGSTAADSKDTFQVSDKAVVVVSSRQGPLRTIALGRTNGRPSFDTLYVQAGANAGAGNVYQVTPSNAVNIVVDGTRVQGGANAGRVEVISDEPFSITRSTDPAVGPPQSRVTTTTGAGFGFLNVSKVTGPDGVGGGGRSIYAVGADAGGGPRIRVYDAVTNAPLFDKFVYDPGFRGGVRVATGDVNGDGVPDIITGAGLLGGPHVQVFDGLTFQPIASFFAYEPSFRGGVYVATGDVDGDGKAEIITGTGVGGGPLVRVFDGTGKLLTQLFPFESTFRGGVNVAAGDVNGDGRVDIITTPGPGGGAVVRAYDSATLSPVAEYFAFDPNFRGGLFVAAGDLDGDGIAEIAVAPAVDGSTEVRVRRGRDGSILSFAALTDDPNDLSAGPPANQPADLSLGGVRVTITPNATADGLGELLAVPGPNKPASVYRYTIDPVTLVGKDDAFEPGFTGGVFIG